MLKNKPDAGKNTNQSLRTKISVCAVYVILFLSIILNAVLLKVHDTKLRTAVKGFFCKPPVTAFKSQNKPFCYFARMRDVVCINGRDIPADSLPKELPNSLIIPAGTYIFNGQVYDMSREGLYRFIKPEEGNRQRIVYESDIDALLSAICWIVTHGVSDDGLSSDELMLKAGNSKLFMTCGPVSRWACEVLSRFNVPARIVGGVTLDEWNSYDNGHRMIEVFRQDYGKWCCYDIDNNVCFFKAQNPLSLTELRDVIDSDDYQMVPLASDARIDISQFRSNGFDFAFFAEKITANEDTLRQWYKRVLDVILIKGEGRYYFFDNTDRKRIESCSAQFTYITEKEFMEKFYGKTVLPDN